MEKQRLFNIEEFDIKLNTEFLATNFVYCNEIDSTNDFLMNNDDYNRHGTVLLAEFQTNGKGRKRRQWSSTRGQNLTFSILLNKNLKGDRINHYNFGAALALGNAIENLFQLPVEMKWPNDILIKGKKVAGILCESASQGDKITKLIIGIGVNVNQPHFPGKYNLEPTSIRIEFKKEVSREKLLSEFFNIFESVIERIEKAPETILNDWRAKCRMIGEKVRIITDEGEQFGKFEDVDENGYLMLRKGDKIEKIHYGDITLRR
ncbi:MAG: biotin--[acetyl-CoA-carboxylase] ligase [Ignavibacteria bacterium]|nr:MAG: biotin--[acetyl-CoA-carboxylase] ligase [Ignavibacteria bacterium]